MPDVPAFTNNVPAVTTTWKFTWYVNPCVNTDCVNSDVEPVAANFAFFAVVSILQPVPNVQPTAVLKLPFTATLEPVAGTVVLIYATGLFIINALVTLPIILALEIGLLSCVPPKSPISVVVVVELTVSLKIW